MTNVTLKVAYNSTHLMFLATYSDASNSNTKLGGASEDRFAILLADSSPMTYPCMNPTSNGAVTSGTANMWHWKAARTDSAGQNFTFVVRRGVAYNLTAGEARFSSTSYSKGGWGGNFSNVGIGDLVYFNGTALTNVSAGNIKVTPEPHPHTFATNEYLNTTARYHENFTEYNIYGLWDNDPFGHEGDNVWAKGNWASNQWTVEFARPLTTSDSFDVQFAANDTFKVAVAAYDGGSGDDEADKQTSAWITVALAIAGTSSTGTTTTTTTATGTAGFELLVFFGGILVISSYVIIKRKKV